MSVEIFTEIPSAGKIVEFPPLSHELGAKRFQEAVSLIGEGEARRAVKRVGPYVLEEELAEELRMKGLKLAEGDEIRALSANHWPSAVELPSIKGEILGFLLDERQQKTLKSVGVALKKFDSVEAALKFLRHLYFEHSLKVVVRYTEPSFHR